MVANTEKKLVIRKAPTEKASTYENGFIATGSDNENYIVTEMKNGFKRWMKMKAEVENVEPEVIVEEKPKRIYKKKEPEVIVEQEKEPEVIVEEKPKRIYKKKEPEVIVEQEKEPEHKKQCC